MEKRQTKHCMIIDFLFNEIENHSFSEKMMTKLKILYF
jgi:hypothetical protein